MKKIILLFALISNLNFVNGQNNSDKFEWSFNTGGGYNNVKRMHYNTNGDLFIMETIGDTAQFGDIVLGAPKQGSYNGNVTFIGKRTQDGNYTVLVKHVSNQYGATFEDFALDSEGNIIVSGAQFSGTTPFDYGNGITLSGNGYFITTYNAEGKAQWAKLYDLNTTFSRTNAPISLGILPNNDIYFAAQSPNGNMPFWLIRLNSSGTEIWHKELILKYQNYNPTVFSSKNNSFFDNEGTAYFYVPILYGNYLKVNEDSIAGNPGTHPSTVYLLSIDGTGNKKAYGGYRGGIGDFCVEKETGNIILKYSQINANPAPFDKLNSFNNAGSSLYLGLVALDKNLNYIKSTSTSLMDTENINALYPLGNLEVVGNRTSPGGTTLSAGVQTFTTAAEKYTPTWIFFDSDLNFKSFIAHPELSGTASSATLHMAKYGTKLAITGTYPLDGNPTITVNGTILKTCFKNLNFGTKFPIFASLAGDIFVSQINLNESVASNQKDLNDNTSKVQIYPNPASDMLYTSMEQGKSNVLLELFDVMGNKVFNEKITMNSRLFIGHLSKGIYTSKISTDNSLSTVSKLIVE